MGSTLVVGPTRGAGATTMTGAGGGGGGGAGWGQVGSVAGFLSTVQQVWKEAAGLGRVKGGRQQDPSRRVDSLAGGKMAAAIHAWGVAGNTSISGEVPLKQHHKGELTCALAAQRAAAWRRAARVHQARVGPSLAHAAVDVVGWALAHTLSARCRSGRGWRGRRRRRWGATAAAVNGRDAGRVGVAGALRLLALAAALDVAWSS